MLKALFLYQNGSSAKRLHKILHCVENNVSKRTTLHECTGEEQYFK